jgi:hypothetical protein
MTTKARRKLSRKTVDWPRKLGALVFASGACLAMWLWGDGNQQIFALPLGFFIGACFWTPPFLATHLNNDRVKDGPKRKGILVWLGGVASWTMVLLGVMANGQAAGHGRNDSPQAIETALSRAEQRYLHRDYRACLGELDRLSVPASFPLLEARRSHDRGLALLRLKRPAEAGQSLVDALAHDPKDVEAACLLSELALSRGDVPAARAYVKNALAIDSSYEFAMRLSRRLEPAGDAKGRSPICN